MADGHPTLLGCGCSSGVEHNLAKVGVEGSNPFARSKTPLISSIYRTPTTSKFSAGRRGSRGEATGGKSRPFVVPEATLTDERGRSYGQGCEARDRTEATPYPPRLDM